MYTKESLKGLGGAIAVTVILIVCGAYLIVVSSIKTDYDSLFQDQRYTETTNQIEEYRNELGLIKDEFRMDVVLDDNGKDVHSKVENSFYNPVRADYLKEEIVRLEKYRSNLEKEYRVHK